MAVGGSLDLRGLVLALAAHEVEWVLAGSAGVLAWHGEPWPFEPGDFDIVPGRSPENLTRLARLLESLEAKPVHLLDWPESLTPEECAAWTPWPAEEARLDHLMNTRLGRLDVVPRRAGLHEEIAPRSAALAGWGVTIRVADPADLLATMRLTKAKHAEREPMVRRAIERRARGEGPAGFGT